LFRPGSVRKSFVRVQKHQGSGEEGKGEVGADLVIFVFSFLFLLFELLEAGMEGEEGEERGV